MEEPLSTGDQIVFNYFKGFTHTETIEFLFKIRNVSQVIGNVPKGMFIQQVGLPLLAPKGSLVWVGKGNNNPLDIICKTNASYIICDDTIDVSSVNLDQKILILSSDPRVSFAYLLMEVTKSRENGGEIQKGAFIHSDCIIGVEAKVGANSFIGNCVIGDNVTIGSNVCILDGCRIGNNVVIKSNSVIGTDGYGFVQNENGEYLKFPHLGNVLIEDNVEIGSNVSIDCASLGSTIIGRGTKIDNLVHIGHNVSIGTNVLIAAGSSIAGSTIIGNDTQIWLGCKIANNIKIGNSAYIGIGSVVINNIEDNKKCFGNPARVISHK